MKEKFTDRTEMILGRCGVARLEQARVAVFGVGGVGGYAVEALARAGVGALDLIDSDKVSVSNINRQIIATTKTVGQYKTEAAKDRIAEINPSCSVTCHNVFFSEETESSLDLSKYDYIIDAIDSVSSKVRLVELSHAAGIPIISAMGAGNKLDPTAFRVADISKTAVCPLAKAVRTSLRRKGINHLKVVYSEEAPSVAQSLAEDKCNPEAPEQKKADDKRAPGSLSFVPSVVGLILAGEVIKDLAKG